MSATKSSATRVAHSSTLTHDSAAQSAHRDQGLIAVTAQADRPAAQHSGPSNEAATRAAKPVARPAVARVPDTSSASEFPTLAVKDPKATRHWVSTVPQAKPSPLFTQKMVAEKKARKEATLAAHNRATVPASVVATTSEVALPLPPPRLRCMSKICRVANWHEGKDYTTEDDDLPAIVKEKQTRVAEEGKYGRRSGWRRLQAIPPHYWPANDFLDLFFSCHGTVFVPPPSKDEKIVQDSEHRVNGV